MEAVDDEMQAKYPLLGDEIHNDDGHGYAGYTFRDRGLPSWTLPRYCLLGELQAGSMNDY